MDTPSTVLALLSPAPDLPIRSSPLRLPPNLFAAPTREPAPAVGSPSAGAAAAGVRYLVALCAHELRLATPSDRLLALDAVADRVQPHAYQVEVVRRVLGELAPAALLADEVGLGKTIEAGLILKELALRGSVRSALILAPKALLAQWQEELRERFAEDFVLTDERRFRGFAHEDRLICSLQQFVRAFDTISARMWDCLIVDEAHLLANPDAKRRRCVRQLRARWRLLLTATPVQNKITDLYSLIDLLSPGRMGTLRQFIAEYAADPATCRAVAPAKVAELRAVAGEVMCRTRRAETELSFVPRAVETSLVTPGPEEAALVRDVTDYLRRLYHQSVLVQPRREGPRPRSGAQTRVAAPAADPHAPGRPHDESRAIGALTRGAAIREIVALQHSLSSSPQAIAAGLRARAERHPRDRAVLLDLASRSGALQSAKEQQLLEGLGRQPREPALIFVLRLETAYRLGQVVAATGRSAECYVGSLSSDARRALVSRFNAGRLQTLIATDAGAEGLNLQERCHVVYNYDLHWNPMKMEQRIGRVHRLGQTQPVQVTSFALRGTIDEHVLTLLYQKIDLFTMTIGALESVLADIQEGEVDIEERVLHAVLGSASAEEARTAVSALGDDLASAAQRRRAAEALTTGVLG